MTRSEPAPPHARSPSGRPSRARAAAARSARALVAGSAVALALWAAPVGAAFEVAGPARASFRATGPMGLTIEGSTPEVTVFERDGSVGVRVALGNLSTGMRLRDEHMRDRYLEVPRFPATALTVDRATLVVPTTGAEPRTARGSLALHGQRREVTFRYRARREGALLRVDGDLRIDLRAFGIEEPSYMGMTVRPEVDVHVELLVRAR